MFERDRRLRQQEIQDREAGGRENVRRQVVLQIERADKPGLFHQGNAQDGPGPPLPEVVVRAERIQNRENVLRY